MGPPSAEDGSSTLLSPPQSPMSPESPRAIPSRPAGHGHKRGGSEFVGGSVRGGDAITVLSSSPTKSDSGYASPSLTPASAARRRGHAHKRSGAISSHDLSSIILPPPNKSTAALRGSSAPSTPAVFDRDDNFIFPMTVDGPEQTHSIPSARSEGDIRQASASSSFPVEDTSPPPRPANRARVGFSDTLEFIPRPLSLVSNETSSTVTARPGHSTSGSISSVISLANSIPADRDLGSPTKTSPTFSKMESRPSTAGAVLERSQSNQDADSTEPSPRRRNSIPHLMQLPPASLNAVAPATPSPTKTPKRWSFFGLEPFVGSSSPTRPRPVSAGSSESQSKTTTSGQPEASQPEVGDELPKDIPTDLKPATRKRSKKQKKVKKWAGSILFSRNYRTRHGKPPRRRTPTPPPLRDDEPEELEGRLSVEYLPYPPMVMITEASGLEDGTFSTPPRPASLPDEDTSYPMIDLDAALGPFNTPLPRNPEWEAAQKAGGHVKRQLHSAAGMTRFTGPGMHYQHRRAESAPEMVPFEAGRFGMHRFNSSSTMADVFEEDEEDEAGTDSTTSTEQSTPLAGTPMEQASNPTDTAQQRSTASVHKEQASSTGDAASTSTGVKRKGSDLSDDEESTSSRMKSEHADNSLHGDVITEEFVLGEPPHASGFDSPNSATPSPRQMMRSRDLAPVDVSPLHLPASSLAPVSPYSMTQSSSFPSPRTPVSYDTQRISTAPSSFTEDNFRSLLMGEPGPEVRISVDGVPSLTSTSSTMTRESIFMQNPQARQPPPSADLPRPASFSASAFGRRRSSLASLSRLISSSHGERSKLSMEVTMDGENEKKPKASKAKRISRMMQFWKPKDANES
ncbi:hypothetical protein CONLIGDRAFT_566539 [Coniochaeta ligniaria NRRL 30616]|uniref:Cell wall proline rich protein n=1 Tax=Coniochaeta ligniaria NRRL 30616 TaxID=1408157 RepID=A0A1J7JP93_9PEZI|nr:hypothetical protein CONLIGDRAFT_566539 [Coniochaeta ligniaria NRRL 30616]